MLPQDFVDRMRIQLGADAEDFLDSYGKPYVKSLRINRRKNVKGVLPLSCNCDFASINNIDNEILWEHAGRYYKEQDDEIMEGDLILASPGKSSLHAAGAYYIQEASAMLPVTMLDINVNDDKELRILDLCAAPGGKSTQIADYMNNRGILVCNEIVKSRAKILSENIERMGVSNALVISSDPNELVPRFPYFFDRILVDAPCSGEGMFRKHEEACEQWSLENVKICADRQDMILDCAASMLAADGKIVYSTCTFSIEEDEGAIERFLTRHPDFELDGDMHRIFPNKQRGEGHFSARLARKSHNMAVSSSNINEDNSVECKKIGKSKSKKSQLNEKTDNKWSALINDFCKENLKYCDVLGVSIGENFADGIPKKTQDRIIKFGDRLFLTPKNMPNIDGLSVLRPGLCLGTIIKDRFEPDHAWALALSKEEVLNVNDFKQDSSEIIGYLKGQTISSEGEKGWHLICTEGLSLGWGKLSNGCIKNHYPKGLRTLG